MPDIELCSICGKKVLISLYPWTKKEIICSSCSEMDLPSRSTYRKKEVFIENSSREPQKIDFKKSLQEEKLSLIKETKSDMDQNEILITWTSVLRVCLGSLMFLFLMAFVLYFGKNGNKVFPIEESTQINSN